MSSMISYDEKCSNCGFEKAKYELFTDLITLKISCPNCGYVTEFEREICGYEEDSGGEPSEWKLINSYFKR
ncbi:MAG: hypothetical protein ACFFG0_00425 [Candidatus Thorarchaeota archaeon]